MKVNVSHQSDPTPHAKTENVETNVKHNTKSVEKERAACNNDAEAVAEDWDVWTVEKFFKRQSPPANHLHRSVYGRKS